VAWTLQNPHVAAAIVGASRPEQIRENVQGAGCRLDQAVLRQIDEIFAEQIVTDPSKTASPPTRP
jgi:aryl-alcohol dehydrogenase-like predicted oxidoreductase